MKEIKNISDFKEWINSKPLFSEKIKFKKFKEKFVETDLKKNKLIEHIQVEDGKKTEIVEFFIENGGVATEELDGNYLIKTEKGSFYLKKKFIK